MSLNHREACVEEMAARYIKHYAGRINNRLEELGLVRAGYDKLLKQQGEHYYQKRISKALGSKDMKTIQLEILKEGKTFTTKYDASALHNTNCTGHSTWHMPTASRSAFEKQYGVTACLMPSDIRRITYGRKAIYDMEELEDNA